MIVNGIDALVADVDRGSIAWKLGVRPGDAIASLDGKPLIDVIDYRFRSAVEQVVLEVVKPGGEQLFLAVTKDPDEPLGLEFSEALFDGIRTCRNRCALCFVDQLPPGLRQTLYVKDDDYRLSFIHGTYVTLTNVSSDDISRIGRQRLTPLYVSVHATDGPVRARMMGNPAAADILEILKTLVDDNIELHAQVVVCPGINDGNVLEATIKDLSELWPGVRSVALVPVGHTRHAPRRAPRRLTRSEARELVSTAFRWQEKLRETFGTRFVYPSDEVFLLAGASLPSCGYYDGFDQIDNGVGLVALFRREFLREARRLRRRRRDPGGPGRNLLITGTAFGPTLRRLVPAELGAVVEAKSEMFGDDVTTAGLLTGGDIVRALEGSLPLRPHDRVLLPSECIRQGSGTFLDDMTTEELAARIGCPVKVVAGRGGRSGAGDLARILHHGEER